MNPSRKDLYFDLIERAGWTFVQAYAAAWLVFENASLGNFFSSETLGVGLVAGVVAVLKGIVASNLGVRNSAATLPRDSQE